MSDTDYDAVIIGAGHNGLVAAAYLARAGMKVLVLEQRSIVGGCASTEELYPDFRFDVGAHDAGLFHDAVIKDLKLDQQRLEFIEGDAIVFSPGVDDRSLTLWRDVDESVRQIERLSSKDAQSYPEFLAAVNRYASMLGEIFEQMPPEAGQSSLMDLLPWLRLGFSFRRRGDRQLMEFMRVVPLTIKEYLDEWFDNELLKGILAGPAISGGMPGVQSAGTTLMLLYQQGHEVNGGCRPRRQVSGGTGQLSLALARSAQEAGAEIRVGSMVKRILLDENDEYATAVQIAGGPTIRSRVIISNADPRRTFFDLIGGAHLQPSLMREVSSIRYGGTVAKVNLALSDLPEFQGADDERKLQGYIVLSPTLDDLERAWDDAKYGRISTKPYVEAVIPTILDPTLAPRGQHILSVTMQYAPYQLQDAEWGDQRERLGDAIISLLAECAPELPGLILHRQVITPLDMERDFGMTEGHIYHGQMGLDQLLSLRPVPGFANYQTPFKNLYLCGAGTHPGGGVTGVPGRLAATKILHDLS